jgi:hypothetical protein
MNDEPDLELEAASAAVDGLAAPDEHALVDSSPSLQADVERFTALRGRIADVTVPAAARESAIAAALAAFDALPAERAGTSTPAPGANVVSLASRRRGQYRLLLGAAAAVAVLGIGAVALNSGGTDNDESSAATIGATSLAESAPAGSAGGAGETERAEEPPVAEKTADTAAAQDDADAEAGDAASAEPAAAPTDDTSFVILAPAEVTPAIESPEELLAYASDTGAVADDASPVETEAATEAPAATESPAETQAADTSTPAAPAPTVVTGLDPLTACTGADSVSVGTVIYQGSLAYVVRLVETGEVRALSTVDCTLLATAIPE